MTGTIPSSREHIENEN